MPGTLYVVATPIGNLEDITIRALRVLREVDVLACEDTRQTSKLLHHYQISKPLTSYHEHNESGKAAVLLKSLQAGKQVALVSDSGTPCISDPGYRLVKTALENGVRVVPIPGPSSLLAALSASGRATDAFTFVGFLPSRQGPRQTFLQDLKLAPRTLVCFEAPHRLLESLEDIEKVMGNRQITVAREVTKRFEEFFYGSLREAVEYFRERPPRGELVLIVEKGGTPEVSLGALNAVELEKQLREMAEERSLSRNDALRLLARELKVPRRELYRYLLSNKESLRGGTL